MSLQFLIDAAEDLQIFRYTLVATTFLVSYEHIVNFDNEVRFLWRRGFTFAGVLLFLCRYLTLLAVYFAMYNHVWTTNVTHSNCVHLITGNTLLVWFQFCLTNLILLVRAYAVWGGSRRILVLLAFAWIAGIGGTSITVVKYIKSAVPVGIKYGGGGCVYTIGDNSVKYSIIDHTFNDLMSLGLLLYKSVHHARAMKSQIPIRRRDGRPTANLLTVMAQDGIIYFVLNLAVSVANFVVIEKASIYVTLCSVRKAHCNASSAASSSSISTPSANPSRAQHPTQPSTPQPRHYNSAPAHLPPPPQSNHHRH
ncbi:hypothetical protein SCHPADRAFT_678931 [Schizopora paradoxa]|uniref:DUF6533 domain-containing protein n=1 Tax=Schizopora paradoxa TaxID=27342 RepID=A0A0H2RB97_9AGAM|nr:hypothetical protein SCHPADRAFT_678931 [Schizopora paradoxa]